MPLALANVPDLTLVLLACLAVLLAVWICLPHALMAWGCPGRLWTSGTPADLAPDGTDPAYADLYRQLAALGFEPLGFHHEAIPFGPRFCSAVFGSQRHACCAKLSRLTPYDDHRLRFLSVFEGNGVVLTKNDEDVRQQHEDYLRQGIFTRSAEETLNFHLAAVERYRAAGWQETPGGSLEDLLEAEKRFYQNHEVRTRMRSDFGEILKTQLGLLGTFAGIGAVLGGAGGAAPWGGLALGAIGWKILIDRGFSKLAHRHGGARPPKPDEPCLACIWPRKLAELLFPRKDRQTRRDA
jgi:hypothetical protein